MRLGSPATGRWPNDSSNTYSAQGHPTPPIDPHTNRHHPAADQPGAFAPKTSRLPARPCHHPPPQRHPHSEILWRDYRGCRSLLSIKQDPLLLRLSKGRVGAVAVSDPSQRMRIRGWPQTPPETSLGDLGTISTTLLPNFNHRKQACVYPEEQ